MILIITHHWSGIIFCLKEHSPCPPSLPFLPSFFPSLPLLFPFLLSSLLILPHPIPFTANLTHDPIPPFPPHLRKVGFGPGVQGLQPEKKFELLDCCRWALGLEMCEFLSNVIWTVVTVPDAWTQSYVQLIRGTFGGAPLPSDVFMGVAPLRCATITPWMKLSSIWLVYLS